MARFLFLIPLVFFASMGGVPASAQQIFTPIPAPIYIPPQTVREQFGMSPSDDGVSGETVPRALSPNVSLDFTYRYNRTRTQENLRSFIDKSPNAEAKAEMQRLIRAQPNLISDLRSAISPYGLDTHDVVDAYTFWMINAWLVANKRDEDPSRGTIAMVKQQVRGALGATPDMASTTDAQRQEYAEALLVQGTLLASAFEQWQNDPRMLDQLADAARKGAKASGLNLSLITLTRNGFVPRQGADAGDAIEAVPGSEQPVRNASVEGEDDDASQLTLSLAVGAGLGLAGLGGYVLVKRG